MEDKPFEKIAGVFSGISDEAVQTLEQLGKSDETCYVHRSKDTPGLIVCQCKTDVKPDQSFSWVTQVRSIQFIWMKILLLVLKSYVFLQVIVLKHDVSEI